MSKSVQKHSKVQRENSVNLTGPTKTTSKQNHEVHPILFLQCTIGNQAVMRTLQVEKENSDEALSTTTPSLIGHDFSRIPVRSIDTRSNALQIGSPSDSIEREADRVADEVMRMPIQHLQVSCASIGDPFKFQREQQGKDHKNLQTNCVQPSDAIKHVVPAVVKNVLRTPGQLVPSNIRDFFDVRFGHDFGQVRVHSNAEAANSADALQTRAYTAGQDIVFGLGNYDPHTNVGRKILAHELTHVIQQSEQPYFRYVQRWPREVYTEIIIARQQRERELLAILENAIDQYANQYNVPANLLRGIIHYETLERGLLETVGELYKILGRDWTVSLGPGDVQVRRAAEVLYPGRNWAQNPLTPQEFDHIVGQLGTPDDHARLLALTMQDNFRYYGRQPGKTVADRWRFTIARHKAGHGPVGRAQERAMNEGGNLNSWSDISRYMDEGIVQFVNNVASYSGTRLSRNPYQ